MMVVRVWTVMIVMTVDSDNDGGGKDDGNYGKEVPPAFCKEA